MAAGLSRKINPNGLFSVCFPADLLPDGAPVIVRDSAVACLGPDEAALTATVFERANHRFVVFVSKKLGRPIDCVTIAKRTDFHDGDCVSALRDLCRQDLRGFCDEVIKDRLNYEADMRSAADVN